MGQLLKVFVYTSSICVVLMNIYYFSHFSEIWKGEPLTIRGNNGRLGNQMFVFATLYGLSKANNRRMALMPKNFEVLSQYFQLSFPVVDLTKFRVRNPWKIGHWLTPADTVIPAATNIVSGNLYPTSFTFFNHVRGEIRGVFQFKAAFQEHAVKVLEHVKKIRPWTEVFVCVHVRRGDYLKKSKFGWLRAAEGREVDVFYFQKAVQYFRKKYKNITFLAVSDDRKWTRNELSHLGILTLPDAETPAHDLAVLSSCNHTIITYGTFGFWGAFLAGGEVVYFANFIKPDSKMAKFFIREKMYPEEWIGISTTPEGFWDHYKNRFMSS